MQGRVGLEFHSTTAPSWTPKPLKTAIAMSITEDFAGRASGAGRPPFRGSAFGLTFCPSCGHNQQPFEV